MLPSGPGAISMARSFWRCLCYHHGFLLPYTGGLSFRRAVANPGWDICLLKLLCLRCYFPAHFIRRLVRRWRSWGIAPACCRRDAEGLRGVYLLRRGAPDSRQCGSRGEISRARRSRATSVSHEPTQSKTNKDHHQSEYCEIRNSVPASCSGGRAISACNSASASPLSLFSFSRRPCVDVVCHNANCERTNI